MIEMIDQVKCVFVFRTKKWPLWGVQTERNTVKRFMNIDIRIILYVIILTVNAEQLPNRTFCI